MTKVKKVNESQVTMTELVLPNHTNQLGKLLGGQFIHSINLGDTVTLFSSINRVFNTSMEVGVKVFSESFKVGKRLHTNTAYLTFVSVDSDGKPVKAIDAVPETSEEKRRYEQALQRRDRRLRERIKTI
jgi:acyl-CoA hydrolase